MRKSLLLLTLLVASVQVQAAVLYMAPPQRAEALSLEDYMAREKRCKELGGESSPTGYRIATDKVVVTGLECTYNKSVFQIPKQKEQVASKDADSE